MHKHLLEALKQRKNDQYLLYHARRFDRLLCLMRTYYEPNKKVLDIGRSSFTHIASQTFDTQVDTLGFESDKEVETGQNYQFDLNNAQNREKWRTDLPKYDMIVFCEVVEHLYTSPRLVLQFLHSLLNTNGIVFMQTPNAVVAHKRIQLLFGQNPYMLISEDTLNPGHFREYTVKELMTFATHAQFNVIEHHFENYFDYRYTPSRGDIHSQNNKLALVNYFYDLIPKSLKPGLSFVLQKKTE